MSRPFGVANKLTVTRLLLSPLVVLLFWLAVPPNIQDFSRLNPWLLFVSNFLLFALDVSDLIDGYLARHRKEVSDFGKLVDPLADKITHLGGYLCLMYAGLASLWVLVVLVYRESLVCTLRVLAAREGTVVQARRSGKFKTTTQSTALNFLFLFMFITHFVPTFPIRTIALIFNSIVVLAAIYSAVDYFIAITQSLKRLPWDRGS